MAPSFRTTASDGPASLFSSSPKTWDEANSESKTAQTAKEYFFISVMGNLVSRNRAMFSSEGDCFFGQVASQFLRSSVAVALWATCTKTAWFKTPSRLRPQVDA